MTSLSAAAVRLSSAAEALYVAPDGTARFALRDFASVREAEAFVFGEWLPAAVDFDRSNGPKTTFASSWTGNESPRMKAEDDAMSAFEAFARASGFFLYLEAVREADERGESESVSEGLGFELPMTSEEIEFAEESFDF